MRDYPKRRADDVLSTIRERGAGMRGGQIETGLHCLVLHLNMSQVTRERERGITD